MSEHTKTPWAAFKDPQTGNWFVVNSPSGLVCEMDGSGLTEEANARHIVHCVNNIPKVVEALQDVMMIAEEAAMGAQWDTLDQARALLAALEAEKGGEL